MVRGTYSELTISHVQPLLYNVKKEYFMNYTTYYSQFLGILDTHQKIIACQQRDIPLNHKYYHTVIATEYKGEVIYSVSPKWYDFFVAHFRKNPLLSPEDLLKRFQVQYLPSHTLEQMYRMGYQGKKQLTTTAVAETAVMFASRKQSLPPDVLAACLEKNKEIYRQEKKHVQLVDGQLAAIGRITDIDCGGGNIAVYTEEEYRKQGHGAAVVKACIQWCLKRDILPIYLVDVNNIPSVQLAKGLDFKPFSREWVLREECL